MLIYLNVHASEIVVLYQRQEKKTNTIGQIMKKTVLSFVQTLYFLIDTF